MSENNKKPVNYLKVGSDPDYIKLLWDKTDKVFEINEKTAKQTGKSEKQSPLDLRKEIEPWLTALFQSERLNLLIGSGLTIAQESLINDGGNHTDFMKGMKFDIFSNQIKKASEEIVCQPPKSGQN